MCNKLTIQDVRAIAMSCYESGGDVIIELWTDEDIAHFVHDGGTKHKLFDIMKGCQNMRKFLLA